MTHDDGIDTVDGDAVDGATVEQDDAPETSAGAEPTDSADGPGDIAPPPPRRNRLPFTIAIAAAVLVLDQLTKNWALGALNDGAVHHVVWTLRWNLTFNSGMAFSRGQGVGLYIGVVAVVVVVMLVVASRRSHNGATAVALGLIIGGALGNLVDRLFRGQGWLHGHVVDFIDVQWWPVFNVADMGVTIGGALMVLFALVESTAARR